VCAEALVSAGGYTAVTSLRDVSLHRSAVASTQVLARVQFKRRT
jgi:hypothetical protein